MFAFVAKHRGLWPVALICGRVSVLGSGFYGWLTRPLSARARRYAMLADEIRKSVIGSDRTYGARRVWRDVLEAGISCDLQTIERLTEQNALLARPRRRLSVDTGMRLAVRSSAAEREVGDTFHLFLDGGRMALRGGRARSVIALDRRLVIGSAMTSELVTVALIMPVWRRGPPRKPKHNTDRSSQHTSEQCQCLIADHGICCSFSRAGVVWDNAPTCPTTSSCSTIRDGGVRRSDI